MSRVSDDNSYACAARRQGIDAELARIAPELERVKKVLADKVSCIKKRMYKFLPVTKLRGVCGVV